VNPKTSLTALLFSLHLLNGRSAVSQPQTNSCVVPHNNNALLKLMQCCSNDLASHPDCREYDPVNRYVIIKDNAPTKPQAFLLIPTGRLTGIDDKGIFKAPFLNLWANAWDQSERFPGWGGSRRIALAINSVERRSQNQLHIHMSCINPRVAEMLDAKSAENQNAKSYTIQLPPANNTYSVTLSYDLTDHESPFWLARETDSSVPMARKGVAVTKAKEPGRYYILTTYYNDGKGGGAEELLDERCAAAP
jgi:CDP-diacylglycerol pyrophosphatase